MPPEQRIELSQPQPAQPTQPAIGGWPSGRLGRGRPAAPRFVVGAASLAVPAAISVLTVRYLVPSRLEGARGGLTGFWAWLGYHQPLLVGIALFVAISEAGRYWLNRLRPVASPPLTASRLSGFRSVRRMLAGLACVALVAYALRASVVATFEVVGPSMLPTLELGDRVLVNRLAYGFHLPFSQGQAGGRMPRRGDLVVFRANGLTGANGPQSVVKRVVGLPGDKITSTRGLLSINDWQVPACDAGPYVDLPGQLTVRGRLTVEFLGDKSYLTVRNMFEPPFTGYVVKPGEVFVVGDDRGWSSDSRLWNDRRGAGVAVSALEGRVTRVLLGARPDGRLDFGRLLQPPFELKVRIPGFDLRNTEERINDCLARRPADTSPPPPRYSVAQRTATP
jgi:signal peptidase I